MGKKLVTVVFILTVTLLFVKWSNRYISTQVEVMSPALERVQPQPSESPAPSTAKIVPAFTIDPQNDPLAPVIQAKPAKTESKPAAPIERIFDKAEPSDILAE